MDTTRIVVVAIYLIIVSIMLIAFLIFGVSYLKRARAQSRIRQEKEQAGKKEIHKQEEAQAAE